MSISSIKSVLYNAILRQVEATPYNLPNLYVSDTTGDATCTSACPKKSLFFKHLLTNKPVNDSYKKPILTYLCSEILFNEKNSHCSACIYCRCHCRAHQLYGRCNYLRYHCRGETKTGQSRYTRC